MARHFLPPFAPSKWGRRKSRQIKSLPAEGGKGNLSFAILLAQRRDQTEIRAVHKVFDAFGGNGRRAEAPLGGSCPLRFMLSPPLPLLALCPPRPSGQLRLRQRPAKVVAKSSRS